MKIFESKGIFYFYCSGCKNYHGIDSSWTFNGDYEKPTISPSILCNKDYPELRCHSFVKDGQIQYLNDCYHNLKNTTIDLEDVTPID